MRNVERTCDCCGIFSAICHAYIVFFDSSNNGIDKSVDLCELCYSYLVGKGDEE